MHRRLLTVALCGALLVGCTSTSKPKHRDAPKLVEQGLAQVQTGKPDAALALFRTAAEADPANKLAHYNIAVILQDQGKNAEALAEYGKALVADPRFVPALFNEATIFTASNPALAITTYRQVVQLQAKAPTAYLNLGLLEFGTGQRTQGLKDLLTALHQDPTLVGRLTPAVKQAVSDAAQSPAPSASATP